MLNTILTDTEDGYLYIRADGEITRGDCAGFAPAVTRLLQSRTRAEPLPVMIELGSDFDADSVRMRWQEAGPEAAQLKRLGRVALVGDAGQQETASQASSLLRGLELRFFEHARRANAEQWLRGEPLTELPS